MGALEGRVAVITGAGRGIGAAIARRFAAEGASLVLNDVDAEPLELTAKELTEAGTRVVALAGSVAAPDDATRIVEAAGRELGTIDVLVNNAGITRDSMIQKMSDQEWDLVLDVSLRGTFNMCRAAYPLLRGDKANPPPHHRKVINLASINGVYGAAANCNYSAAKAGVIGFTKAIAREWGHLRINANCIAPGYIEGTRLTAVRGEGDELGIAPDVLERIVQQIPIGRGGRPEDIAGLATFLASPDSDYVTGQVIEAHGGLEIVRVLG